MRKVLLKMNEQLKYEKIKNYVDHGGNKKRLTCELGLTIRQINRLIIKYKERGKSSFIHGNRSRYPRNKMDLSLSNKIITFYTTKYQGFNFVHFKEFLEEVENIKISYNCLYNLLMKNGIVSPKIQRLTKKKIIKKAREAEKNKDNDGIILEEDLNPFIDLHDAHPRRERKKYFGEEIQMDASLHLWFGTQKAYLHLAIDNCTGRIVGGFFDWQETLFGYYNVLKAILMDYGIPASFLTDNRTIFNYQKSNKKDEKNNVMPHFKYACRVLGIEVITTSISQAKGQIERLNGTLQSRLISEFRLNQITTIERANHYLINTFIPRFNKQFALDFKKHESVFMAAPSEQRIDCTLSVLYRRKFDNGNAIKYNGNYYQPYHNEQLICVIPKTECLVIKTFNNDLLVSINDKTYELRLLNKHAYCSKEFDDSGITNAAC